jgi:hypothetical protein
MPPLLARALFGAALAVAIHGWGAAADALLRRGETRREPLARGALGLAVLLAIGGGLNWLHLLVGPVYWALFGLGFAGAATALGRQLGRRTVDWPWWAIVAGVALLLLPVYAQAVDTDRLNPNDDFFSYLVMPLRILQTGTLEPDLFNYRAAISGPGGLAFLQAPTVGLFGINAIRLADQGVGLLVLIGALATLFRRLAVPIPAAIVTIGGAILLAEHSLVNVTSYFTTMALLVGLILVLGGTEEGLARPLFAAGLLAAVAALKNTAVPFAGLLCICFVVRDWRSGRAGRWRNPAVAAVTAGVILAVWYLPRLAAHVRLLPLAHGDGPDEVSVSYMLWWIASGSAWNWTYLLVFAALWVVASGRALADRPGSVAFLVGLAVLAGSLVMTYATGAVAPTRYNQPLFLLAYLVCAAFALGRMRNWRTLLPATLLVTAGFVAFRLPPPTGSSIPEGAFNRVAGYCQLGGGQPSANYFRDFAAAVAQIANGQPLPFAPNQRAASARRMQDSMAPGTTAVVRTDQPFLLNFARNRLFIADYAAASPAPGLPLDSKDSQRWVDYYRSQSVRYLVYAYATEAGFPAARIKLMLENPRYSPWQRALVRPVPAFHEQLLAIAARWPRVYDDGNTVVVDLASPPAAR